MKYLELRSKIKENIFVYLDVMKLFPQENLPTIKAQLSRFVKKGLIYKIKRGLYCLEPKKIDEFELAGRLYQPSYISLETALNYYGLIPDIPQGVTSLTLVTTKKINNEFGTFYYARIKPALFWGYDFIPSPSGFFFNLAKKEKALLDYFYLRKIKTTRDLRLDLKEFDYLRYKKYAKYFPRWVERIKL